MKRRATISWLVLTLPTLGAGPLVAEAAPSLAQPLGEEVYMVRDDAGNWGGPSMGMTHQRGPDESGHYEP